MGNVFRDRVGGWLECGRSQMGASQELRIVQSVLSRLWQRFLEDGNVEEASVHVVPGLRGRKATSIWQQIPKRQASTPADLLRQLSAPRHPSASTVLRLIAQLLKSIEKIYQIRSKTFGSTYSSKLTKIMWNYFNMYF
ncbi:hypothetical protein AVEN_115178-1 [Araneus ventricosus]|uniref:Uncharacterized protein n=1 Tax=Araneus ventricosus TaxID=182803 RepID=A0A4Y1ZY42_ARAVE|nr:hypothetical protein AVEN_115178-1 [Araneus ventricosus]